MHAAYRDGVDALGIGDDPEPKVQDDVAETAQ
jgi:hypothetical protein